jgi:hypothetical protein
MPDSRFPASDDAGLPSHDGESVIERAIRQSFGGTDDAKISAHGPFTQEDHASIASSGAADLSAREKGEMLGKIPDRAPMAEKRGEPRTVPLFFGSWSGMNPFRFVKPFFLQKKPKGI